jgi:hypothetical protein
MPPFARRAKPTAWTRRTDTSRTNIAATSGGLDSGRDSHELLVSEATAYRYFPDLISLLREAMRGVWPDPAAALEPIAACTDPADRIAYATGVLMRHVLAYQSSVRATIAATISRPNSSPGSVPATASVSSTTHSRP